MLWLLLVAGVILLVINQLVITDANAKRLCYVVAAICLILFLLLILLNISGVYPVGWGWPHREVP